MTMMTGIRYTTLFSRLLSAVVRLEPMQAAVCGIHWERWVARQQHHE